MGVTAHKSCPFRARGRLLIGAERLDVEAGNAAGQGSELLPRHEFIIYRPVPGQSRPLGFTFLIGGDTLHGAGAYIAIAGLLIYTGSFAIGLGPVFWLLISEIYPVKIRGQAMSVATMANWGANFVVTVSFLTLLSAIGNAGTFFLFGGLSLVAVIYFQRQVPETKNRSLQEIERDLGLPKGEMAEDTADSTAG